MGMAYTAICNNCQTKFKVREGGGFNFVLLHCDSCGEEKEITQQQVDQAAEYKNKPLPMKKKAELIAGPCSCGGKFLLHAKARCPNCNSDDYSIDDSQHVYKYD